MEVCAGVAFFLLGVLLRQRRQRLAAGRGTDDNR